MKRERYRFYDNLFMSVYFWSKSVPKVFRAYLDLKVHTVYNSDKLTLLFIKVNFRLTDEKLQTIENHNLNFR